MGASQVGSLVHEIAHDLEDTTAPAYAAEVRARWGRLGLPDNWLSRKSLAEAVAMTGALAGHIAQSRAQGWERVGTEVDVDVKVGTARIIGRVDRVERDALGRVRIVDLKTGSSKPSVAEVERHPQLGAYQVAVDAGGFGPGVASAGAALLQLGKAAKSTTDLQVQRALRDDPDPRWATDLIARDAEAMAGASFLATPSRSMCGTCQVRSSCPAQAEGRSLS
jgi:RecB family exonuclease